MESYPKRLIEVDLPIREISAHARREKSIRHGHISTLHIWWARRPLAACRAVICAALWPDPADPMCPPSFVETARTWMRRWATDHLGSLSPSAYSLFVGFQHNPARLQDPVELRHALLAFIADFANWDNSSDALYLETSRSLTQASHEALGGTPGTRPVVVDPFAGGGAIPLEALRVGADAFGSDSNPLPVLLNRVTLQHIPRFGQRLADEVRARGARLKDDVEMELSCYYPADPDGSTPIAYMWARTILCEGPGCGADIPLVKALWLCRKPNKSVALRLIPKPHAKRVEFEIVQGMKAADIQTGTVRLGPATCPLPGCGYTTPKKRVREQLAERRGGAADARLVAVVTARPGVTGKEYRLPTERDLEAVEAARVAWTSLLDNDRAVVPDQAVPQERVWKNQPIRIHLYGMLQWRDIFAPRQGLALSAFARRVRGIRLPDEDERSGLGSAVRTCLALAVSRQTDYTSSLCTWHVSGEKMGNTFKRQAISMVWDFAEVPPFADASGGFAGAVNWVARVCEAPASTTPGQIVRSDARSHPLPDQSTQAVVTDPPYYDAVPYAAVADYFYVWLRQMLKDEMPDLFQDTLIDKACELVVDDAKNKDHAFYETGMTKALAEAARILVPSGIAVVVFAHLSTDGWEAMLSAVMAAGLTITASWPIDTEMSTRLRAMNSAALASSVHLACRPRVAQETGDWRAVLGELPRRMHEWMPRLAAEGVVGADAIFACLGPALEIFSRYARVEKASGEPVELKEYLEQVWAAVSREALHLIFEGADASGLEEDARLTAMWLWTLSTGTNGKSSSEATDQEMDEASDEEDESTSKASLGGFAMEFDTARKIAQGLGVHIDRLTSVVQIKGDSARLLPVAERSRWLFENGAQAAREVPRRARSQQMSLFAQAEGADAEEPAEVGNIKPGDTTLDQIHQAMLLFGTGRSNAVKRLLVDEGVGSSARFWKLAQALSALYPSQTEEKRWVDGVLARKKGLGF